MTTRTLALRRQPVDPGWTWVAVGSKRARVFGASRMTLAEAGAAGASGAQRHGLGALREAGRSVLQASRSLVRDRADEVLKDYRIHEGMAVTSMEHDILTGTIELEEADRTTSGSAPLN